MVCCLIKTYSYGIIKEIRKSVTILKFKMRQEAAAAAAFYLWSQRSADAHRSLFLLNVNAEAIQHTMSQQITSANTIRNSLSYLTTMYTYYVF